MAAATYLVYNAVVHTQRDAMQSGILQDLLSIVCRRLQEERKYKSGWCYRMLRSRWGEPTLREFSISIDQ